LTARDTGVCASTLVNAGVSIDEIQKLLGHSNIATTQR